MIYLVKENFSFGYAVQNVNLNIIDNLQFTGIVSVFILKNLLFFINVYFANKYFYIK